MSLKITDKRIDSIRDLFCLQSTTGLSYSDMATLTKDDIQDDVIVKRRKKNRYSICDTSIADSKKDT